MGHSKILKSYCRICLNTNDLEKMTTNEQLFFFVNELDPNRICSICRRTVEILLTTGARFSSSLKSFKIKGMDIFLEYFSYHYFDKKFIG